MGHVYLVVVSQPETEADHYFALISGSIRQSKVKTTVRHGADGMGTAWLGAGDTTSGATIFLGTQMMCSVWGMRGHMSMYSARVF